MGRAVKEVFILGLAALAGIYLINPTAGIFELLPDNIPLVGNVDEATATLILLSTLRHYGLDLTRLYGKPREEEIEKRRTP
jgi:hypothetical protein